MGVDKLPRQDELVKPAIRPDKAMLGEEVVLEGVKVDAKKVDVKIQFSWRDNKMAFDFKDVPVK